MLALGVSLVVEPVGLLIHAGFFFFVLVVFSRFLLKPFSRVFAARLDATTQRDERAAKLIAQAETLERDYESRMHTARQEAHAIRDDIRHKGFTKAAEIMQQARSESMGQLDEAKAVLQREAATAKAALTADSKQFAKMIAEKIVERDVRAVADGLLQDAGEGGSKARKAN